MSRRPQKPKAKKQRRPLRNAPVEVSEAAYDSFTGRGDPQGRFRIYRLCLCETCGGTGKVMRVETGSDLPADGVRRYRKCEECRGEGKTLECVGASSNPEGVGLCMVTLGMEGEFEGCPIGLLDTQGEKDKKWLIRPWMPSARNVSDAARTLAQSRGT